MAFGAFWLRGLLDILGEMLDFNFRSSPSLSGLYICSLLPNKNERDPLGENAMYVHRIVQNLQVLQQRA